MSSTAKNFMSDNAFIDTNVVVYALGGNKQSVPEARIEQAQQIMIQGGVVSVQVMNEFVQVCRRAGLAWSEILDKLQTIEDLCSRVLPLTLETHRSAVALSKRYGFHIYDASILAVAQEANCTIVYSEDMQHGQKIGALKIVNPFLSPT
jgi:predicted nucleic acid-binding protein